MVIDRLIEESVINRVMCLSRSFTNNPTSIAMILRFCRFLIPLNLPSSRYKALRVLLFTKFYLTKFSFFLFC